MVKLTSMDDPIFEDKSNPKYLLRRKLTWTVVDGDGQRISLAAEGMSADEDAPTEHLRVESGWAAIREFHAKCSGRSVDDYEWSPEPISED